MIQNKCKSDIRIIKTYPWVRSIASQAGLASDMATLVNNTEHPGQEGAKGLQFLVLIFCCQEWIFQTLESGDQRLWLNLHWPLALTKFTIKETWSSIKFQGASLDTFETKMEWESQRQGKMPWTIWTSLNRIKACLRARVKLREGCDHRCQDQCRTWILINSQILIQEVTRVETHYHTTSTKLHCHSRARWLATLFNNYNQTFRCDSNNKSPLWYLKTHFWTRWFQIPIFNPKTPSKTNPRPKNSTI